jgi:hypothetical protein
MLDIDCCAQSAHIFRDVIAEDNTTHGRLARAALAHKQHLALLLTLSRVHDCRVVVTQSYTTAADRMKGRIVVGVGERR